MRPVGWGLALWACLMVSTAARAEVYLYRDSLGVLHFTNAPTDRATRLVLKALPKAPLPRILTRADVGRFLRPVFPQSTPYDELIREIAERNGVEYALTKAVIKAESDFDSRAISRKGALGLMQLMPQTAAQHQVRDVFFPRDNIEGGCRHLRMLLDRYGGNLLLAIAAYNAGAQRVEEAGGVPAIPETREYLARVLRYRLTYMQEGAGVLEARR